MPIAADVLTIRLYYPTATTNVEKYLSATNGKVTYYNRLIEPLAFRVFILVLVGNEIFLFEIYYNLCGIIYNVYNIKIIKCPFGKKQRITVKFHSCKIS